MRILISDTAGSAIFCNIEYVILDKEIIKIILTDAFSCLEITTASEEAAEICFKEMLEKGFYDFTGYESNLVEEI